MFEFQTDKPTTVIYHDPCPDGFCCAWLLHRAFPQAHFVPAKYGDLYPPVEAQQVIIVDFSYPAEDLQSLCEIALRVVVLDHHPSAERRLKDFSADNCDVFFDMTKSGARLTWEWLIDQGIFPTWPLTCGSGVQYGSPNRSNPCWLVQYTEDRDLWNWELDHSHEISSWLSSLPMTFTQWDQIASAGPETGVWTERICEGAAIIRYQAQCVDRACDNAIWTEVADILVPTVNVSEVTLISDIGHKLSAPKSVPFSATWFRRQDGKFQFSLRSASGHGVNVAQIAEHYGGGGHQHAAGFELNSLEDL